MQKWLVAVVVAVGVGSLSPLAAVDDPADDVAKRLLGDAENDLRRGNTSRAVKHLRRAVKNYRESPAASTARARLAELGFGLYSQVVLTDQAQLEKRNVHLADVVARVEALYEELQLFFRQTYKDPVDHEFRVEIFDSRDKFHSAHEHAVRRSESMKLKTQGPSNLERDLIAGYFDNKIASREDKLDILWESVAREMSRVLIRRHTTTRGLPEPLEVGLSEYLALRLFSRRLTGTLETPEHLTRALARNGLGRVQKFSDFKRYLHKELPRQFNRKVRAQWVALSYALIDLLVNGDLGDGRRSRNGARGAKPEPRIAQLQAFLRDYIGAHKFTLEQLLERHFDIELKFLHQALLRHVARYPGRTESLLLFTGDF